MRMAIKLVAALAALVLSAGCWDRVELNNLALVTAAAFDKGTNDAVRVTLQFYIPKTVSSGGGGGNGGQERQTTVRFEEGENLTDALARLQMRVSRKIFWGQCKVIIFSEELARAGIREHFDLLVRSPQPREHSYVFVSEGKAANALHLHPPMERTSAAVLWNLTRIDTGISVTVEELSIELKSDYRAQTIPIVRILPIEKEPHSIPYIVGTAVLKNGRMTGKISEVETRGVKWVLNEIREYNVTFEVNSGQSKGRVSLHPVKATTKVIPRIENGEWQVDLIVKTQGDLVQNGTLDNPLNPQIESIMEKAFADEVGERIKMAVQEIQHHQKADIFRFAEAFHRKYPKQWAKVKDHWEKVFPEVKVNVRVNARINRPGVINNPAGVPIEQVYGSDGVKSKGEKAN